MNIYFRILLMIGINLFFIPIPKGPYFGQKPPGMQPEIFAPDILVKPKQAHSNIVFSKAGTEAYWCNNGILFSKLKKNTWTTPKLVPFSKEEFSDDAPFLSPDGKHIFFASKRPINDTGITKKENIWMVDLEESGWSKSIPLNKYINFQYGGNCAMVSQDGKFLFYLDIFEGQWQRYWINAVIIDKIKRSHPQKEDIRGFQPVRKASVESSEK